jgi:ATP synthase protein I
MAAGMRIAVELMAAIAVGTVIGILLDRWLGTAPWLLLLFFVVGAAAGFVNVYRTAKELDRKRSGPGAAGGRGGRG